MATRRGAEPQHNLAPRHDDDGRYQPAVSQYAGGRGGDDRYGGDRSYTREPSAGRPGIVTRRTNRTPTGLVQLAAVRRHQVTLACLAVILGSLIWKAVFLSQYFYRQDDFLIFDAALKSGLNWGLIHDTLGAGQFDPGSRGT